MLIRPATVADIPGLYQLALAYDSLGTSTTAPADVYAARVAEILQDPKNLMLVAAEPSGHLVGYAYAQDYGSNPRREFTAGRLNDLFVLPDHRRKGIARQLMAEVVAWARPRRMILDWQSRRDAVPFYESLGLTMDTVGDLAEFPAFGIDLREP